jgi:hypothetical protein
MFDITAIGLALMDMDTSGIELAPPAPEPAPADFGEEVIASPA